RTAPRVPETCSCRTASRSTVRRARRTRPTSPRWTTRPSHRRRGLTGFFLRETELGECFMAADYTHFIHKTWGVLWVSLGKNGTRADGSQCSSSDVEKGRRVSRRPAFPP